MLVTPEPRCSALPVRFNRPAATLTYAVSGLPTGLPCSTHPNPWPLVRFTVRLQVTPLSSVGPNTLVSRRVRLRPYDFAGGAGAPGVRKSRIDGATLAV